MKCKYKLKLPPLNRAKLTDSVVTELKDIIFSGQIPVGEKLPSERNLAENFKISRSVVREALGTLENAGLIEIRRGRSAGAYIVENLHKPFLDSTIDLVKSQKMDIHQIIEARKALECYNLRLITEKITEKDIIKLEEINDEFMKDAKGRDRMYTKNSLFHLKLSELSGNVLVNTMLKSLLQLMEDMQFRFPTKRKKTMEAVYNCHSDIIEAIRQKDWIKSEKLLALNIEQSKDMVCQGIKKSVKK